MWQLIRQITLAIITASVLLLAVLGWRYIHKPSVYPVRKIKFSGSYHYVKPDSLRNLVKAYVPSGFFSVNLSGVLHTVQNLPWIYEARVARIWPDTILITFKEQQPIARWGENAVMNIDGKIFQPERDTIPNNLPVFFGESAQSKEILLNYQQLQESLTKVGCSIAEVHVTPGGSYWITLDNQTVLRLGNKDLAERLGHFVESYDQVFKSKSHAVESVDLRYPSGMAVKWRQKAYKNTQDGSHRGNSSSNVEKIG
jgi:cell division protein FtsQ